MATISETDPNNDAPHANPMALGDTAKGSLSSRSDWDFFKITAAASGVLTLDFSAPTTSTNYYFQLDVYDAAGKLLAENFVGNAATFSLGLPSAGNYYIAVTSSSLYSAAQYSLTASNGVGSASGYENEGNDTLASANRIALNQTIQGQLAGSFDIDYYRAHAAGAGMLVIDFAAAKVSTSDSFTVGIYDASGNLVERHSTAHAATLSVAVAGAGDYYVKIEQASKYDGGNYSLTVSNDGFSNLTAKYLTASAPLAATLSASHDWYAVNLVAGSSYEFALKGATSGGGTLADPALALRYSVGATLETRDDLNLWSTTLNKETTIADPQIAFTAPVTGTYYLMVTGNGGSGSYTLSERSDSKADLTQDLLELQVSQSHSWNSPAQLGRAVALSYAFLSSSTEPGFLAMTAAQKLVVKQVLAMYASIANIAFTEVSTESSAEIRFGTSRQADSAGVTYTTYLNDVVLQQADVYLDNSAGMPTLNSGSYGLLTLIHEVGHALGLKHPGNYDSASGSPSPPYLPLAWDNTRHTVMSYVDNPDALTYADTPRLLDIAAVQYLYGANISGGGQAKTYTFSNGSPFTGVLLSGNSRDTIDLGNQSMGATLLLVPGTLSSVGVDAHGAPAQDNLTVPFSETVVKAIGGSGNDWLVGSDLGSTLSGGAGNDTLMGGLGVDTALFSGNRANYTVTASAQGFSVTDNQGTDGTDVLSGIEKLQFADQLISLDGATAPNAASYQSVVQEIYIAYFGRPVDYYGMLNLENALLAAQAPTDIARLTAAYASNPTIKILVDQFGTSPESAALYPGTSTEFVRAVFNHVLNRNPLPAGQDFWAQAIDQGGLSKGNAALAIMNGALENQSVQGKIDALAVANKVTVANSFTGDIDTFLEINAYVGAAAAASARSMLQAVTDQTNTTAYQSTVTSTLLAMTIVPHVTASAMAVGGLAAAGGAAMAQMELLPEVALVGLSGQSLLLFA